MDQIFDPDLLRARKRRAFAKPVAGADFLLRTVEDDLVLRLSAIDRSFTAAGYVHAITPAARIQLETSGKVATGHTTVTDTGLPGLADATLVGHDVAGLSADSIDLAISLLTLQDANDLPGMLVQIRRALKPDGLFIGALIGGGTLAELREALLAAETELTGGASPRVHPFADIRDIGALLQRAGFALPVTDLETYAVRYDSAIALMADLRAMGATSALARRSRRPASRALFARAAAIYAERFSDPDGRVRATFNVIWMSGWAPHESQQKPLMPGSASFSLEEALKSGSD